MRCRPDQAGTVTNQSGILSFLVVSTLAGLVAHLHPELVRHTPHLARRDRAGAVDVQAGKDLAQARAQPRLVDRHRAGQAENKLLDF